MENDCKHNFRSILPQNKKIKRCIATVTNDLVTDQRMQRTCMALLEHFDEVILVGRQTQKNAPLATYPFQQHRLKVGFKKGILFYAEYNIRLFWYLLFQKPHTLWAVDLDTLLPAVIVAQLTGNHCVYDAHEYFVESPELMGRPKVQKIWDLIGRWAIPKAQKCVTVGPALAKIMGDRYGVHFEVMRNVPEKGNTPSMHRNVPEQPILFYQGALNVGRGLEALIAAMPLLPQCVLHIAGDGDISGHLKNLAEPLGDQVVFLGRLAPKKLAEFTTKATIGLNLLENMGQSYYYSLANKAFDYLQSGLPALHMDFPEYRFLSPTAVLLPDLEPPTLAKAILEILDPVRYATMVQSTLAMAPQHTWETEKLILDQLLKTDVSTP